MKLGVARRRKEAGILLLECLVYMSILALLLGFAFTAFWHFQTQSIYLRRNVEDISRALHAGEQWRDDIHKSAQVEVLQEEKSTIYRLAQPEHEILYSFAGGSVWRKELPEGQWIKWLQNVNSSEMRVEQGAFTSAWIWELELKTAQKTVRLKPLFSFVAVPGGNLSKGAE